MSSKNNNKLNYSCRQRTDCRTRNSKLGTAEITADEKIVNTAVYEER